MKRIIYCPLEAYKERYTMQLAAPKTGWMERNWLDNGIDYKRVEGDRPHVPQNIGVGVALDAIGRSKMCFAQVSQILNNLEQITENDVIYFDDFWHPGIEAIAYAAQLMGRPCPAMYANLWAQSVDQFDFTYPMRDWIRHFEKGIGKILSGIFVACPSLKHLVQLGEIAPHGKIHAVGHPFSSEEVMERMPPAYQQFMDGDFTDDSHKRTNRVVYSSRWDREKRPEFFLAVVDRVRGLRPDVTFTVCTSSPEVRSNDRQLLKLLDQAKQRHGDALEIKTNLTKEEYYGELVDAKIQINTADQDWISYVLLEASVAGAYPVYPNFRSFPEVFLHREGFMYHRLDVDSAASTILRVLGHDKLWTRTAIKARSWIHSRFDTTWRRMAIIMGVLEGEVDDPFQT